MLQRDEHQWRERGSRVELTILVAVLQVTPGFAESLEERGLRVLPQPGLHHVIAFSSLCLFVLIGCRDDRCTLNQRH